PLTRMASWRRALAGAEAVLVLSEQQRDHLERSIPEMVGRVWVVPEEDQDVGHLIRRLQARYRPKRASRQGCRIAIVGYNLKFITRLSEHLSRLPGVEIRIREWPKYAVDDDSAETAAAEAWADTILAEWCGPNAVGASHRKRPGQRLVIRLHRFELERDDWREIDIDQVNAVVAVGHYYRELIAATTGWPPDKIVEVPNWVDVDQFRRPKLPDAPYTLGLLGAVPSRKRLDRALDVIELLHQEDSEFILRIKSDHPWDHKWIRDDPGEAEYFRRQMKRLDELMKRGWVIFDAAGPDVAAWLRKVGTILSTSDDESFHLAPAEGMASGAVPVIWSWPGATDVYEPRWVVNSVEEMAARVAEAADTEKRARLAALAFEEIQAKYSLELISMRWEELLGITTGVRGE
ncbi:MAG: glycosyltransferase family 4 protein, partial [Acidimicrobiia bacterium]